MSAGPESGAIPISSMKAAILVVVLFAAVATWLVLRVRQHSVKAAEPAHHLGSDRTNAGRELRLMMLNSAPKELGATPTREYPRIYGLLMDWPLGDQIATVFATSTGAASLYTTAAFGILGGEAHEAVRNAAAKFVRAADRYLEAAIPTTEFPYPAEDRVRFYLLTFEGVRFIDTELAAMSNSGTQFAVLFGNGQEVLTKLRIASEKRQ